MQGNQGVWKRIENLSPTRVCLHYLWVHKVWVRMKEQSRNVSHTKMERKVVSAFKQRCGLKIILSSCSILKMAALFGVLSSTVYNILNICSLHKCVHPHRCSPFLFGIQINLWHIIFYSLDACSCVEWKWYNIYFNFVKMVHLYSAICC